MLHIRTSMTTPEIKQKYEHMTKTQSLAKEQIKNRKSCTQVEQNLSKMKTINKKGKQQ